MEIDIKPVTTSKTHPNTIVYEILDKENNKSVGYFRIEFSYPCGNFVYLADLWVNDDYRKMGIATKTVKRLVEFLKSFGVSIIWLFVPFDSEIAQHIYRKAGFEFKNDISDYCYKMELILNQLEYAHEI